MRLSYFKKYCECEFSNLVQAFILVVEQVTLKEKHQVRLKQKALLNHKGLEK